MVEILLIQNDVFFSGFRKFLVIFLGEPAVHFPGKYLSKKRKEFVSVFY